MTSPVYYETRQSVRLPVLSFCLRTAYANPTQF